MHGRGGRRLRAAVLVAAVALVAPVLAAQAGSSGAAAPAVGAAAGSAGSAGSAAKATKVRDPERWSEALIFGHWEDVTTVGALKDYAKQGFRVTDLEVVSGKPLRLTATMVFNSGVYDRTWWFYVDQTAASVKAKIKKHGARLLDLERYRKGGKTRFAIVLVRNKGQAAKTWWWQLDRSTSWLKAYAKQKKARIVDLDSRSTPGGVRHDAVLIRNQGVDTSKWWFYPKLSAASLRKKLKTNKARLIDLERVGAGRWSAVMERNQGQTWWWFYDARATDVDELLDQHGARPYHVVPYGSGKDRRFAVLMMNDVNQETGRLRALLAQEFESARYGFWLKRVGGTAPVALQPEAVFEPASAIKALHHLHQLRRVASGADALSDDDFVWYHYPSSAGGDGAGVCPNGFDELFAANQETDPIGFGLQEMMKNSDNRTTRGFQLRYGNAALNATADLADMDDTVVRQVLGCGFQGGLRNDLTLIDIGKLYEGVVDGSLLSDANGARAAFWRLMNGGPVGSTSRFASIARQEGAALGVSSARVEQFIGRSQTWSKGGSYDVCWPGAATCSPPYQYIRTVAGRASLPIRTSTGGFDTREWVFGRFVERKNLDCRFRNAGETATAYGIVCPDWAAANADLAVADAELFRSAIRSALVTWL